MSQCDILQDPHNATILGCIFDTECITLMDRKLFDGDRGVGAFWQISSILSLAEANLISNLFDLDV
jgi:hypothetical protein